MTDVRVILSVENHHFLRDKQIESHRINENLPLPTKFVHHQDEV